MNTPFENTFSRRVKKNFLMGETTLTYIKRGDDLNYAHNTITEKILGEKKRELVITTNRIVPKSSKTLKRMISNGIPIRRIAYRVPCTIKNMKWTLNIKMPEQ